jgi:hypothetical protein
MLDEAYSLVDPSDASASEEYEEKFKVTREVSVASESENGEVKEYEVTVTVTWPPAGNFRIKGLRTVYAKKE